MLRHAPAFRASRANCRERLYGNERRELVRGTQMKSLRSVMRQLPRETLQTIGPKIILSLRRCDLLSQCRGASEKES
jgi:hypothetical protein